jgi:hypothetical protein
VLMLELELGYLQVSQQPRTAGAVFDLPGLAAHSGRFVRPSGS